MTLVLIYGLALLAAVLFSEWSRRTVLSSAVLFLAVGYVAGPGGAGVVSVERSSSLLAVVADLALFSILFSDGMKLGLQDLRRDWRLPLRALGLAMPATALLIAWAAWWAFDLTGIEALLLGAILSPTDPVFAAAILGREEIPSRVRHLLNVESGVNDGLALPFVLALTAAAGGGSWSARHLVLEPVGGLAFGAAVALLVGVGRGLVIFSVAETHEPLLPLAVALIVLAGAQLLGVNEYLAAFAAGAVLASISERARREFRDIGERLSGLLKLAAVLIIAVTAGTLSRPTWPVFAFAAFVLVVPRTVPLLVALAGTALTLPERLVAAWFGPRGFASLLYALLVLKSSAPGRELIFQIVAVTVLLSIVLHSSTDVPVAHRFAAAGPTLEPSLTDQAPRVRSSSAPR